MGIVDFTFTKGDAVAFFRSDAMTAEWTQDEMNVHCVFPFLPNKEIERGMIILFQDQATDDWKAFTIRQCQCFSGYQQIEAEDLAITELSACHIDQKVELRNKTADIALAAVLFNTGWLVGTIGDNPTSSGDLSRGSAWQNIHSIEQNWNVHIVPRVVVNSDGIAGRYLDIISASGVDRGLRLAVNKNISDPCVTYDDSELYTALYGYGATYTEKSDDNEISKHISEYTFASVKWDKTNEHPAKPKGLKYLEDTEATALYGLNGRPRFGYYQNTNIDDPKTLLQKTWETLQTCNHPKISIDGTVTDMKRLGYKDVPMRLYDLAIIELEPLGVLFYKQIIKLTVNLLDATKNRVTIGDYIPSIIYINREVESFATGGGKGAGRGGGGSGRTKTDLKDSEYQTRIYDTGEEVGMVATRVGEHGNILNQAGLHISSSGVLIYSEDNANMIGAKFRVLSDKIESEITSRQAGDTELSSRITQTANKIELEVSQRKAGDETLAARIKIEADKITQEVIDRQNADQELSGRITVQAGRIDLVVSGTGDNAKVNAASIVLGINGQTGSYVKIQAAKINLDGYVTTSMLESAFTSAQQISTQQMTISQYFTCLNHNTVWKTYTARFCSLSGEHTFMDTSGTNYTGRLVTGYTDTTLYYLGR